MRPANFLSAGSFQELAALVERPELASVLALPVQPLVSKMAPGVARDAVADLVHAGELKTLGEVLHSDALRRLARKRGGPVAEGALLRGIGLMIALGVHGLAPSEPPRPPAAAVRPSGLYAGMPPDELDRWAAERSVSGWLKLGANLLQGMVPPDVAPALLRFGGWETPLAALITLPVPTPGARGRVSLPDKVREAAFEVLEGAADMMARGLAEEETPRVPPEDPRLAELWAWLTELRAQVRAGAAPLPRDLYQEWKTALDEDPPAVKVHSAGYAICGQRNNPTITVALTPGELPSLVACDCARGPAACQRKIGALDLCLDVVADPARAALAHRMVELRARPSWARALARLDPLLELTPLADKEGNPQELGWRVRVRGHNVTLSPVACRPKVKGRGYRMSRVDLSELRVSPQSFTHPADAAVAATLLPGTTGVLYWARQDMMPAVHALALLAGHPRVFLEDHAEPVLVRRAAVTLHWTRARGGGIKLRPMIEGQPLTPKELLKAATVGAEGELFVRVVEDGQVVLVVELPPRARPLIEQLAARGADYPREATAALLGRYPAFARLLPNTMDPALRGPELPADSRPVVRLEMLPGEVLSVEALVQPLVDGSAHVPGEGPDEVVVVRPEGPGYSRRDRDAEPEAVRAALASVPLPPEAERSPFHWLLEGPERALPALEALQALGDALRVVWRGDLRRRVSSVGPRALQVSVAPRRDWLGLHGALEFDGEILALVDLLRAVRSNARYVPVSDRTWLHLSEPFREALAPLANAARETGGEAELSGLLAPLVQALAEEGASVEGPLAWVEWLQHLEEARTLEPALPDGLLASLRDYQRDGYAWLVRLSTWAPGACLADDMGLGKTVQALALLLARASGPALVVTPTSVSFNWLREAARFAPSLKTHLYRGPGRQAMLEALGAGDVLVTSYDVLVRDVEALSAIHFRTLVLDEAQAFKNPTTRRARAVCSLQADFRLALTGTPIENRTSELWSLFRALSPSLLGSWEQFRDRFATPIEREQDVGRRRALSRVIRPFVLRRHKSEVARELPPRTEVQVDVDLSREERALYERIRRDALEKLADGAELPASQRRIQVLAALTRLRQAACHPRLVEPDLPLASSKIERLREILSELKSEGHRALVFSQFVRLLTLVRASLDQDGVQTRWLDGSMPEKQRRVEVDAWQRGEADAFLLSLKAGGTGLNLTAATYVIHLDPWWNPAVEDQATDRAHRIGQDQPVTVLRLVARGTLEEAILSLHAEKRALASEILEGTGSTAALSTDELMALLAGVDVPEEDEVTADEPAEAAG